MCVLFLQAQQAREAVEEGKEAVEAMVHPLLQPPLIGLLLLLMMMMVVMVMVVVMIPGVESESEEQALSLWAAVRRRQATTPPPLRGAMTCGGWQGREEAERGAWGGARARLEAGPSRSTLCPASCCCAPLRAWDWPRLPAAGARDWSGLPGVHQSAWEPRGRRMSPGWRCG
jgi:hypothetical protein